MDNNLTSKNKKNSEKLKRERFVRIAEIRVNKLLDCFDSLGKCANTKNYKYTEGDTKKIFAELEKKIKEIKLLFQSSDEKRKRFRISE